MVAHALKPQSTVREFVIHRVLGQGAYGITYLASHSETGTRVAIKEYFPQNLALRDEDGATVNPTAPTDGESEDFDSGLQKFLEEARTLAGFVDRRIVEVLDSFEHHGTAYVVMAYEEGGTLSRYLAAHGEPIPERDLLEIFIALLEGLRTVHAKWILHRDIKPENVYIRKSGDPLLIDFGTARHAVAAKRGGMTEYLTPGYAPPEQYERKGNHGPWTDIYALGATMYYCTTRIVPYDGRDRLLAIRKSQVDPIMPAVKAAPSLYRRQLLELIDWMMAPDPKDRAHSVDDVLPRMRELRSTVTGALAAAEIAERANQDRAAAGGGIAPQSRPADGPEASDQATASRTMPTEKIPLDLVAEQPMAPRVRRNTGRRRRQSRRRAMPVGIAATALAVLVAAGLWWYFDRQQGVDSQLSSMAQPAPLESGSTSAEPVVPEADTGTRADVADTTGDDADPSATIDLTLRLQECAQHIAARRLTTGREGNAFDCYVAVLAEDPLNAEARAGLTKIEDTYLVLIEDALRQAQPERAKRLLSRLADLNPQREEIAPLRQRIEDALASSSASPEVSTDDQSVRPAPQASAKSARGPSRDMSELMREAAENGIAVAQYNMAVAYYRGAGVPQDDAEAAKWFLRAAEQGVADAQYNLGAMYQNGRGVLQDLDEALRWYRKAADAGVAAAQYALGLSYEEGIGVEIDRQQAQRWYEAAATQGHPGARAALEKDP